MRSSKGIVDIIKTHCTEALTKVTIFLLFVCSKVPGLRPGKMVPGSAQLAQCRRKRMMTKATSCCNTDTHYMSREVQTCSAEFMMQVRQLKTHYHLCTKLFLQSRGKITLKKDFLQSWQQVLTFSNLLHRKTQIEAEFHHGQVS